MLVYLNISTLNVDVSGYMRYVGVIKKDLYIITHYYSIQWHQVSCESQFKFVIIFVDMYVIFYDIFSPKVSKLVMCGQ